MMIAQDGEELIFPKISRTDSGAYLCIASNGVPPSVSKRIILDVECKSFDCFAVVSLIGRIFTGAFFLNNDRLRFRLT